MIDGGSYHQLQPPFLRHRFRFILCAYLRILTSESGYSRAGITLGGSRTYAVVEGERLGLDLKAHGQRWKAPGKVPASGIKAERLGYSTVAESVGLQKIEKRT